jgi:hypothetical protein
MLVLQNFLAESACNIGAHALLEAAQDLCRAANDPSSSWEAILEFASQVASTDFVSIEV